MSGHGRGEASSQEHRVAVEVRSVNHRFCRIGIRMPSELSVLEEQVRRLVQERVQRGKVDLNVSLEGGGPAGGGLDLDAARRWAERLRELAGELQLDPPSLSDVLELPGVMSETGGSEAEALAPLVEKAAVAALQALDEMRRREGEHLAVDLEARMTAILEGVEEIEAAAGELPARTRDALRERIGALLEEVGRDVDEERLIQEAAYHAERADITEEVVRLRSHLEKARGLLQGGEPVGRTLEFLTQEIHRELSTIGAKTKELDVAEMAVDLKAELERIREQVQNVE